MTGWPKTWTAAFAAAVALFLPAEAAVAREGRATVCREVTRCLAATGPERRCRTTNRCYTIETQRRVPIDVKQCARRPAPHNRGAHHGVRTCRYVTRYRFVRVRLRRCEPRTVCTLVRRPSAGRCQTMTVCRREPARLPPEG